MQKYGHYYKLDKTIHTLRRQGVYVDQDILKRERNRLIGRGFASPQKMMYVENICKVYDKPRVYPEYFVSETKTGRWVSRNPNIQGFPNNILKRAIIPPSGWDLFSVDLNQAEFVLFLKLLDNRVSNYLLKRYKDKEDLFYNLSLLTGGHRKVVKKMVYEFIYSGGLGSNIDINFRKVFCDFIGVEGKNIDFNTLPYFSNGYVMSLSGRMVYCNNKMRILNYYLQSSIVDIINEYCILTENYDRYNPYIVIHDCIVFAINPDLGTPWDFLESLFKPVCYDLDFTMKRGGNWYEVS